MKRCFLYNLVIILLSGMVFGGCRKFNSNNNGHGSGAIICNVMGVETKGSTISTSGVDQHGTTSESIEKAGFVLAAYAEEAWHYNTLADGTVGSESNPNPAGNYFKNNVTYSSTYPEGWTIAGDPKWLNGIDMTFWSWNTAAAGLLSNVSYSAGTDSNELTFDCTLPASTAGETGKVDATNQKDIVFAYNREKRNFDKDSGEITSGTGTYTESAKDAINIHFYHALSEVLFAVSPDDGMYDKNIKIKSICIKNVYASGSCTVKGARLPCNHDSGFDPSQGFSWSYSGERNFSFIQDYDGDFSGFDSGNPQSFLPKPTAEAEESQNSWHRGTYLDSSTSPAVMRSLYCCNNKFFMIPQILPSEGTGATMLSVTFDNGGVETTLEKSIGGDEWKAGYYYKYKINYQAAGEAISFSVSLVDWDPIPVNYEI